MPNVSKPRQGSHRWIHGSHTKNHEGIDQRLVGWLGERRAVLVGLAVGAAEFTLFAFVASGWQAYALSLFGALSGLVFPAINGLVSRMTDASHQGALQGGIGSMGSVAAILGPLLLTQAMAAGIERGLPGAAFLAAGLLAAVALAIVAWTAPARLPAAPADPMSPSPPTETSP